MPLTVKEMMFGTGNTYAYLHCSNYGCLEVSKPEKDSEKLYPGSWVTLYTMYLA